MREKQLLIIGVGGNLFQLYAMTKKKRKTTPPYLLTLILKHTANGSACSHDITEPQEYFRDPSGSDSGTMYTIKNKLKIVIRVASSTTWFSPPVNEQIQVPRAGLITRLAANVPET